MVCLNAKRDQDAERRLPMDPSRMNDEAYMANKITMMQTDAAMAPMARAMRRSGSCVRRNVPLRGLLVLLCV